MLRRSERWRTSRVDKTCRITCYKCNRSRRLRHASALWLVSWLPSGAASQPIASELVSLDGCIQSSFSVATTCLEAFHATQPVALPVMVSSTHSMGAAGQKRRGMLPKVRLQPRRKTRWVCACWFSVLGHSGRCSGRLLVSQETVEHLASLGAATTITFVQFAHELIKPSTEAWEEVPEPLRCGLHTLLCQPLTLLCQPLTLLCQLLVLLCQLLMLLRTGWSNR